MPVLAPTTATGLCRSTFVATGRETQSRAFWWRASQRRPSAARALPGGRTAPVPHPPGASVLEQPVEPEPLADIVGVEAAELIEELNSCRRCAARRSTSRQFLRSKFLLAAGRHSIRRRTGTAGYDLHQLRPDVVQAHAVVGSDPLDHSAVDQLA